MLKEQAIISRKTQDKLNIKKWDLESFGSSGKNKIFSNNEKTEKQKISDEAELIRKNAKESGFEAGKNEGYQIGLQEGLEAAKRETDPLKNQLTSIIETLSPMVSELEEATAKAIIQLSYQIAAMVIRVEGRVNSAVLQATLKEMFSQLPSMLGSYTLAAHSQDVLEIESYLAKHCPEAQIHLQTDDTLTPGGVRLKGPIVFIEGSLEQRLLNLIQQKSSL